MNMRPLVASFPGFSITVNTDVGYQWCWAFLDADHRLVWGFNSDKSRAALEAEAAMKQMGIRATITLAKLQEK